MTRKEDNTPRNNREKGGNGTKKKSCPKDNSLVLLGALIHFIAPAYPLSATLYRPFLWLLLARYLAFYAP